MRDYNIERKARVEFIKNTIENAGAKGVVFGNSGGKDSALAGILCREAAENVLGVMMPCDTRRNYGDDINHAELLAKKYNIENITVDLTDAKKSVLDSIGERAGVTGSAKVNIAPRLRMTVLYTIAQSLGYLVMGTGNKSEYHMGYFTKWGDGAYDFNPIFDLTVTETYEFLKFLNAPEEIINKPPSGGLFDGQTDEAEMGITYKVIDGYLLNGAADGEAKAKIEKIHNATEHKRNPPVCFS